MSLEENIKKVIEAGNFDDTIWDGSRWSGHTGFARADKNEIYLLRQWGPDCVMANREKLTIKRSGKRIKVWLVPENDSGPWLDGVRLDDNFEDIAEWLSKLDLKVGPTGVSEMMTKQPEYSW